MNSALDQLRDKLLKLAISHQRIAADKRNVQRLVPVDKFQNSLDEFVAFEIAQSAKGNAAAEMLRLICITAGTSQRTFTRNFNRK